MRGLALRGIVGLVLVVGLVWFVWTWGFCRFYVEPNEMAVITAKIGKALPPGQILAEPGQKGMQRDVLGEGRHFLNPIFYEREIVKAIVIPPGKIGVVTSKVGVELPEGEFLAGDTEKGIWRRVLGPGKYRMNPRGYLVEVIDAISVPIGYGGVITSLSGEQAPPGAFAGDNQKGVRRDILQPGLYYVNPAAHKIDVLEIGVNQVSLLGKLGGEVITKGQLETQNAAMDQLQQNVLMEQKRKRMDYVAQSKGLYSRSEEQAPQAAAARAPGQRVMAPKPQSTAQGDMPELLLSQFVEFPSRDGFQISLDMTVEVELLPDNIAWVFSNYGDLPAVVDKTIMPQITSISRNKGSEYGAKDFIVGEGREKFQTELTKALAETLAKRNIVVHNALIRHVEVPQEIREPIQQASIAIEQNLTNKEKQNTAKKLAELNTELALIVQRREQVGQETQKLKAEIKADEEKQVAGIKATAQREVARIARETAGMEADIVRKLATAEATAIRKVEGEKARGMQLIGAAFADPTAFSLWKFAGGLSPELAIQVIHTGPGTLWTDLEKARAGELGGALLMRKEQ